MQITLYIVLNHSSYSAQYTLFFNVLQLQFWYDSDIILCYYIIRSYFLIGVTSTFSLTFLIFQANKDFPKVPYIRAVDIFTGVVLTLTAGTLLETILVHVSESKHKPMEEKDDAIKDDVEKVLNTSIKYFFCWI